MQKLQNNSSNAAAGVVDKATKKGKNRMKANSLRKQKSRERLRVAAEKGDVQAIEKLKAKKEANKIICKKYRKRKKDEADEETEITKATASFS